MRKIFGHFLAVLAVACLVASPVAAQNTALASPDLVRVTRVDANGDGTPSASGVLKVFDGVGIGYSSGSAVTQGTGRTTAVVINAYAGAITLISAAGSATPASFTVTNNKVAATDTILVVQKSGTDLYEIHVTAVAAGSFRITSFTTGGTTTEQPVFNFAIVRAAAS
jgi:outer membrane lipoprotein SlyB